MKNWLSLAALICLGPIAHADLYTSPMAISSDVWTNVSVASAAPVRVDYLNQGTTGYVLNGRNQLVLTIPKSAATIGCQYEAAAATSTTGTPAVVLSTSAATQLGAEYDASSTQSLQVVLPLGTGQSYWCQSYGTTNPNIHVDQTTVIRPTGRFPGSP